MQLLRNGLKIQGHALFSFLVPADWNAVGALAAILDNEEILRIECSHGKARRQETGLLTPWSTRPAVDLICLDFLYTREFIFGYFLPVICS